MNETIKGNIFIIFFNKISVILYERSNNGRIFIELNSSFIINSLIVKANLSL